MTTLPALSRQLFNAALFARIHSVWFKGVPVTTNAVPEEAMKRWFGLGSAEDKARFDGICHAEFAPILESLSPSLFPLPPRNGYTAEVEKASVVAAPFLEVCGEEHEERSQNALALIILLDQIPRNIFRKNQAVIYNHYDQISISILRSILASEQRPDLHPSLRMWFYMPLMHSEHIQDHEAYLTLIRTWQEELRNAGQQEAANQLDPSLKFEDLHIDIIIKKFGRYPHRNVHLGRESTAEEKQYLSGGGNDFGTGHAGK